MTELTKKLADVQTKLKAKSLHTIASVNIISGKLKTFSRALSHFYYNTIFT